MSARHKMTREFWVGLFSLVGIGLLVFITMSLRSWDLFSDRTTYYALFEQVSRLDTGAKVLISGVQRGEVAALENTNYGPYNIKVTLRIDKDVTLYKDALVQVQPAGVIGDTTVNIDRGSRGAEEVEPGDILLGESAPQIEKVAGEVGQQLSELLTSMQQVLNDPENIQNVRATLTNLANASQKMDSTFSSMDETFRILNDTLRPLVSQLQETSQKLNGFLAEAEGLPTQIRSDLTATRENVQQTAQAWTSAANTMSARIDETAEQLTSTARTIEETLDETRPDVQSALAGIREASDALAEISAAVRGGEGTLGRLINDPGPFNRLNQVLDGLASTLTGSRAPAFSNNIPAQRVEPKAADAQVIGGGADRPPAQ